MRNRARHAISALAELAPQTATVLRDGRESSVPIDAVSPGDRVVVKPAERIPVDDARSHGTQSIEMLEARSVAQS
ncbi:MAG: P-type ATPase [Gemmatimonadaceae bacterium]